MKSRLLHSIVFIILFCVGMPTTFALTSKIVDIGNAVVFANPHLLTWPGLSSDHFKYIKKNDRKYRRWDRAFNPVDYLSVDWGDNVIDSLLGKRFVEKNSQLLEYAVLQNPHRKLLLGVSVKEEPHVSVLDDERYSVSLQVTVHF